MLRNKKLQSLIVISFLIIIVFPLSGKADVNSIDEETEDSEWKTAYYCWIRGDHVGGIIPEGRIGFAFKIEVDPLYVDSLELKINNEFIPIEDLSGRWFFRFIGYYSIPRIPARIFGFLIYCEYLE